MNIVDKLDMYLNESWKKIFYWMGDEPKKDTGNYVSISDDELMDVFLENPTKEKYKQIKKRKLKKHPKISHMFQFRP